MSTEAKPAKLKPPKPKEEIKVTVSFPISPKGPFKAEVSPETTAGVVREDAMSYFGVAEDDQHEYYLSHSGAKVNDDRTVGDVAGEAKAVKFTLVKELIQG